jgi:hypothetical protein
MSIAKVVSDMIKKSGIKIKGKLPKGKSHLPAMKIKEKTGKC